MLVMSNVTDPCRVHTMTKGEDKREVIDLKGLLARDTDFVRAAVEALVQAALEAEMTEAIGAEKGERSETRLSYRSGYYGRSLITRVGTSMVVGDCASAASSGARSSQIMSAGPSSA